MALLGQDELAAADVGQALGVLELRPAASVIESISWPVLETWTTEVPPSPTTKSVSVSQL